MILLKVALKSEVLNINGVLIQLNLRSNIGVVPQQPTLCSQPDVSHNISYGDPHGK